MKTTFQMFRFLEHYFTRIFIIFAIIAIETSCGGGPTPQVFLEVVDVTVAPQANQDSAVAMDLIVVYDDGLIDTLFKLSANSYFAQKQQIMRDNPGQIDVWSWEVVPGQVVPSRQIKFSQPIPRGGIFFANYLTPGDHRIRVGKETGVKITLAPKDFSLQPFTPQN